MEPTDRPFSVAWKRLSHAEEALHFVHFSGALSGWAVGENGVILATRDGGESWQPQSSFTEKALWGVYFVDASTGWVAGRDGTLLTTGDGGQHWRPQASGTERNLTSLYFVDALTGWAVGENGTILSTHDGGRSWKPQQKGPGKILWRVQFTSTSTGWAVGEDGTILATRDGGAHWGAQIKPIDKDLTGLHFADPRTGWAVGRDGTILATADGGQHWQAQAAHTENNLTGVHFINAKTGWAVGDNGTICATRDGGRHWEVRRNNVAQDLGGVHFADGRTGWVVGGNGNILVSHDGGATWQPQPIGITKDLLYVHFVDARTGWVVGTGGTILATHDAGEHWQQYQPSPTVQALWGVGFADAKTGCAVGDAGIIVATRDGGRSWQRRDVPWPKGPKVLWALFFVKPRIGWAVGREGTILATTDGGWRWMSKHSGPPEEGLADVHFVDARTGWAVGLGGTILATTDGGESWQRQASPNKKDLSSVYFIDASTGWAVGDAGTILATPDGRQWHLQSTGTNKDLKGVCFGNRSTGWAVGQSGTILATRDGGEHWQAATSDTDKKLWAVQCSAAGTGWAVGETGTRLRASPPLYAPWIEGGARVRNDLARVEISFEVHRDREQPPLRALVEYQMKGQPWKVADFALPVPGSEADWRLSWMPGAAGVVAGRSLRYRVALQDGGPQLPPFELGAFVYRPRSGLVWPGRALAWVSAHPRGFWTTIALLLVLAFCSTRLILLLMQMEVFPINVVAAGFYLTRFGRWRLFRGYRRVMQDVREFQEDHRRFLDLPYELAASEPEDRAQGLSELVEGALARQRVVVVGEGGRGKTTLCHYVVIRTAAGSSLFAKRRLEPVIVDGYEITGDDLTEAITSALRQNRAYVNRTVVEAQLVAGNLLVIFDGVSDVHRAFRAGAEKSLRAFARSYPDVSLLLTSREEISAEVRSSLGRTATVRLRDVDAATERAFLARHLKHGDREVDSLIDEIRLHFSDLPRIPLMLHLVAVVYDQTGAVPKDRTALFTGYAQQLLRPDVTGIEDQAGLLFAVRHLVLETHVRTGGAHLMTLETGVDLLLGMKEKLEAFGIEQTPNSLLILLVNAGLYKRTGDNFTFYYGPLESYFAAQALEREFDRGERGLLKVCAQTKELAETWDLLKEALGDRLDPSTLQSLELNGAGAKPPFAGPQV
jgi:photosystem II stability/assembly factor-like uncharacterized protein